MARKMGWHILHRFEGNPDWRELNRLIAFDSGNDEPYCGSEEDYQQAVKEGWIKFDGKVTTVWADGEYEEQDDRKYAYDQEYIKKNLKRVLITFNQNSKADMDIYEWLNQQTGSKVAYIKSLIENDMDKNQKEEKKMIIRMTEEEFDLHNMETAKLAEGEIYTVVEYSNILTGAKWYKLMAGDFGGVAGNQNPAIRKYHGWRGTTNDVSKDAEGVRRIEKIIQYKNGNYKIVLSGDLVPDKE